jgi:hypothetical protein
MPQNSRKNRSAKHHQVFSIKFVRQKSGRREDRGEIIPLAIISAVGSDEVAARWLLESRC